MPGTRERLLTAALDLMRARGFRGTGLKDVTSAAAATTGSLYHFFPGGKSELVAAAVREDGATHEAVFLGIARASRTPGDALATFFEQAADVLEQTGFVDLCPIGTVAGEVASTDDAIRLACGDAFSGWRRAIAVELNAAGANPTMVPDLTATAVAALLGGFVLARTTQSGEPLRAAGRQLRTLVDAHLPRSAPEPVGQTA